MNLSDYLYFGAGIVATLVLRFIGQIVRANVRWPFKRRNP